MLSPILVLELIMLWIIVSVEDNTRLVNYVNIVLSPF
jgi:hypothetical protein